MASSAGTTYQYAVVKGKGVRKMDRDALIEAFRELTEGLGWIQTIEGGPSLYADFRRGVGHLEEAKTIMRAYVEEDPGGQT